MTPHHPLLIEPIQFSDKRDRQTCCSVQEVCRDGNGNPGLILGARAAATFLRNMNLFFGQPKEFFTILKKMADEADAAFREI